MYVCPVVGRQETGLRLIDIQHATGGGGVCAPTVPCIPFRTLVLPWVEAPLGESTVPLAAAGAEARGVRWSSCACTRVCACARKC